MILYGNSDKIVTNWGEKIGELSDLVIILAMQISLYLVKTWVKILSLFVSPNFVILSLFVIFFGDL